MSGREFLSIPLIGTALVLIYRTKIALQYQASSLSKAVGVSIRWLVRSREYTNFSYEISELSRLYIASAVSVVCKVTVDDVLELFSELESDTSLQNHINEITELDSKARYQDPIQNQFGRRLAWYAVIRLVKPELTVETGVDKGLGACTICAALEKNHLEGFPGRYIGLDINPRSGGLLSGPYAQFGEVHIGDALESLADLALPIDVFINDSDHSVEYEAQEYNLISGKLSPTSIVIGDNCHETPALLEFSRRFNRRFLYVNEQSMDHIYPGAGVGISYRE